MVQNLTAKNKEKLASLLCVDDARSLLWQIKQPPSIPSTDALKILFERLEHIEALEILQLDISWLNQNYKRQLIRQVRYYSVTRIKSMPEERQHAFLICLCHKLYEETIDYIVEMVIKLFDRAEKHATKEINSETQRKRREIKKALEQYRAISEIILNEDITNEKLRETIYAAVSEKKLREQLDNTTSWLDGKYSHVFHLLQDRHSYFRKFFPGFIQHIALCNDGTKSATELLKAVELLKQLNRDHDNKCPEDAPTDFIPKALTSLIIDDEGNIDRHGWETALLQAVRDEIKHGNVSVNKGRFFSPFDQLFMPDEIWQSKREAFFEKAGLPSKPNDLEEYLSGRSNRAIDLFVETEKTNTYAKVENNQWSMSVDTAQQFSEQEANDLMRLHDFLRRNMRRRKLPDLLIDVDNDLHFTHYLMPYNQRELRDKKEISVVIAAIMAWGSGIGLSTMPHLVQDITYDQLRAISDYWHKVQI